MGRMVNSESGGVGEDNCSDSLWAVRRGAMTPQWPDNRVYIFPTTSETQHSGRLWCPLPNWKWVVPTLHLEVSRRGRYEGTQSVDVCVGAIIK